MYKPFKMKGPSLLKFNAGLRKASAEGKLDSNPKFKAAVDDSPKKKYKSDAQRKAVHASKAEAVMKKKGCATCNYGKKKCTCGMASPKKYGKTTMKMDGKKKLKKAQASPTASEKATMKAHNQALKDNPKLYKDSYYDNRRKKAKLIKSKYPGYKF